MFIPDPGSEFFHPGFRIKKDSGSASKNLRIFNPKNCFKALGNMIRILSFYRTQPVSRGQKGTGSGSVTLDTGLRQKRPLKRYFMYRKINAKS
jgi:hypothetical protein